MKEEQQPMSSKAVVAKRYTDISLSQMVAGEENVTRSSKEQDMGEIRASKDTICAAKKIGLNPLQISFLGL